MDVELKQRRLSIDLTSALVAILMFTWSVYYYYTTLTETEEGPESVLFIRPVFYGMLICFPFVLWSTFSFIAREESEDKAEIEETKSDRALLEPRRLILTAISAGYCVALPFLGYLIPSALYVMICCYVFGSRSLWILLALPVGLSAFLSVIFNVLLTVPIPIWPVWFGG
jgi:hypothetical protein